MHRIAFAVATILGIFIALPAIAQGKIVITQAKVLAGNVTPGDTPGFPVHLYRPGAYVLESNLEVPAGKIGINAYANNIDIDLNGFTISGGGVANQGLRSIFGESRIHGGVINRFVGAGISLSNNAWTIEDMKIVRNGGMGIDATGARYIQVVNSLIASNANTGILAGDDAHIEGGTIASNGNGGIYCVERCYVGLSSINANQGRGISLAGDGGIILGNAISSNTIGIFSSKDAFPVPTSKTNSYGNNSLINNNIGNTAGNLIPMQPNSCAPSAC